MEWEPPSGNPPGFCAKIHMEGVTLHTPSPETTISDADMASFIEAFLTGCDDDSGVRRKLKQKIVEAAVVSGYAAGKDKVRIDLRPDPPTNVLNLGRSHKKRTKTL